MISAVPGAASPMTEDRGEQGELEAGRVLGAEVVLGGAEEDAVEETEEVVEASGAPTSTSPG